MCWKSLRIKVRHGVKPAKDPKENQQTLTNVVNQSTPLTRAGEAVVKECKLKPPTTEQSAGESTASNNSHDTGCSDMTVVSQLLSEKLKEPQSAQKQFPEQETAWREPLLDM